jgi:hypothetical protein
LIITYHKIDIASSALFDMVVIKGGVVSANTLTFKLLFVWIEDFKEREKCMNLLHEKGLYSPHRGANAINLRTNMTSSSLMVIEITTEKS